MENLHTICCLFNTFSVFAAAIYCPNFDAGQLDTIAEDLEEEYPDLAILWHDPAEPRIIKGHPAPTPDVPLLIIQNKHNLMQAKRELAKTDYYKNWKD